MSQASLHEVAKAAGTSRGAIYWHFKDKAALFDAMMDRVTLPMELTLERQQASDSSDPLTTLRDMLSTILKTMVSDIVLVVFLRLPRIKSNTPENCCL